MQACILITLCFAVSLSWVVYAEGENEVKKGFFPFMAFIYYPDETVVDGAGSRFLRSAVLIRTDWLISSAIGPSMVDGASDSFPKKTLLARLGAINIDSNLTLNEDEDEQEREVIQIVRPYNHSSTQWWRTDISLLKTLVPFKMSSAVGIATLKLKRDYNEKTCFILIYAMRQSHSRIPEDKILMQLSMELLLPASIETCGHHFIENTMICAADSDENKSKNYDHNFCQGNSGGPLICENEVTGLQTYIENNCKSPHIYQHLPAWDNFITCGAENKCQEEQCANICIVSDKDAPTNVTTSTEEVKLDSVNVETETIEFTATRTTVLIPENGTEDDDLAGKPTARSSSPTIMEMTSQKTTTEQKTKILDVTVTSSITTTQSTTTLGEMAETKSWPKEKLKENRKKLDQDEDVVARKINTEAQQKDVKEKKVKAKRNMAQRNMCIFETVFFGSIVLVCLN